MDAILGVVRRAGCGPGIGRIYCSWGITCAPPIAASKHACGFAWDASAMRHFRRDFALRRVSATPAGDHPCPPALNWITRISGTLPLMVRNGADAHPR